MFNLTGLCAECPTLHRNDEVHAAEPKLVRLVWSSQSQRSRVNFRT